MECERVHEDTQAGLDHVLQRTPSACGDDVGISFPRSYDSSGGEDRIDAGDERCRQGYRYIYTFAPLRWEQVRAFHEAFIGLAIKELEEERVNGTKVFRGVSMDERKREKIAHHHLSELEVSLPDVLPKLLDRGNDRVTFDILTLLKKGDMRPAELREALGISSANYFTARYLTPMVKKGLIEHVTSHARFSPCSSYRLTAKGKAVLHC